MSYGLLGNIFNGFDGFLDDTAVGRFVMPYHNDVQTWLTGSSERDDQRPYFEAIAPMVVDYFFPGVGSGIKALDRGLQGDWTGAGLSAIGSVAQLGSWGSAAGSAGSSASSTGSAAGSTAGTSAVESTGSGLSSTTGQAAGETATAGQIASNADETNALVNASNEAAYTGNGLTAPQGYSGYGYEGATGFSGGDQGAGLLSSQSTGVTGAGISGSSSAPSQYVGYGAGFNNTANASASQIAGKTPAWYQGLMSKTTGKAAGVLGEQMLKQQAMQEQRANEVKMKAQQAMASTAGEMPSANRSYSVQQASPYAQFQGGFNPRPYGTNVRNRGLLG